MAMATIGAMSISASEIQFSKKGKYPFPKVVTKAPAWPFLESKYPIYPTPKGGKYPAWPGSNC